MKKSKFDEKLLNEELKKFRLINEYSFYVPETKSDEDTNNLILGEEDPTNSEEKPENQSNGDKEANSGEELEPGAEVPTDDQDNQGDLDLSDIEAGDEGLEDDSMDNLGGEIPSDDEVEIDVTELVNGTKEAKASSDMVNQKMETLMNQFQELEQRLEKISNLVSTKVDDLENEVEKRMPTPEEKLEMRSLDSFPYSLKLTDYWSEKEGPYDVLKKNSKEPKEYVLTQKDVNFDYNQQNIKNTFSSDYEEEDI